VIAADAMDIALREAEAALAHGDVPIGAVVLHDGEVIARRHNERELLGDPTAHAEILAIKDAATRLQTWRLNECSLVVTLEPCVMCAGAIVSARLSELVFGAFDPKAGATGSLYNVCVDPRLNHEVAVTGDVQAQRSSELLRDFFRQRR
jgi:tRNA(adenine34) deaminase